MSYNQGEESWLFPQQADKQDQKDISMTHKVLYFYIFYSQFHKSY